MPSGFTPPSERSRSNRGDSHSDPDLGSRPLVPAAATIMVQRPGTSSSSRAVARTFTSQRSSNNDANASTSSSDGPRRPPQELSATQATFLAGAAVSHAHHASGVALQAAQAAQDSQQRGKLLNKRPCLATRCAMKRGMLRMQPVRLCRRRSILSKPQGLKHRVQCRRCTKLLRQQCSKHSNPSRLLELKRRAL